MNRTWNVFNAARTGVCTLVFGLWPIAIGCGGAPDATDGDRRNGVTAHDDAPPLREQDAVIGAKYPATWSVVQAFLRGERDVRGRSVSAITALYRPDVDGPAYLEFALRKGADEAGYVIASTGVHDFPIIAWSDRGPGVARSMEKQYRRDLGAARLFMTGPGAFVAESPDGSIWSGDSPLTQDLWDAAKEQFVARTARTIESAGHAAAEWQRVAHSSECLSTQNATEELVRGADILWPPNYAQFYATFDNGYCKVGCVPNAFTQIAAWLGHQAGDHRDGTVWGHPRVAYAFNGSEDTWAPATYDTNLAGVMTEFRKRFGTYCSGNSGMTTYFPYDRISDLSGQLFNQIGAPVNTYSLYNSSWDSYARAIDQSLIQAHLPVEVNAMTDPWGNSAHAWIVWGYRNDCFGEAYRVNMGWDFREPGEWVNKGSVLSALTFGITHGIDGSGIVLFAPQNLSRDHGPITIGAGSGYCLDVAEWSTDDGAIAWQFTCHGGDNQLWYLDRTDMGAAGWQVRNRYSGKCLAPLDAGAFNGAHVVQSACDKTDANTFWKIQKYGATVALKHHLSGRCLDLDNVGGTSGDGRKIQTWDCTGGPNQRFDFAR